VSLSLARPRVKGLRVEHAIAAGIGALLSLALGIVPLDLVVLGVKLLFLPLLTIVSLMVITLVAEHAGLFTLLSSRIAQAARGDGRRLFAYIFCCGAITGSFFTNDAAVLIFTPLVFELVEQVRSERWTLAQRIPFYFAVLYVANVVGALVISNPINIVVASLFHISFAEYAKWMFLPGVASIVVSFLSLRLAFRNKIPEKFDWSPTLARRPKSRRVLALCAAVLSITLVGFFTDAITGVPTWLVAFIGATVLLGIHVSVGKERALPILKGVSWDVLAFVLGIFVVVLGLRHAGLTHAIGQLLSHLESRGPVVLTGGTSLIAAVASSIMNNHPTADMMGWAIRDLNAAPLTAKAMAFSALIGGDLGPKMLPIGSLAALIWFRLLRDRGVQIPYSLYVKIGVPVTLAAIAASVLVLNVELSLAGFLR
jgi:arsenical pump membrane protein